MTKHTTITTIIALLVGLTGGAATTYSWLRAPQNETVPIGDDLHADDQESDEHASHGDDEVDHESAVHLSPEEMHGFDIELATAGPGSLLAWATLPGKVTLNEDRVAHIALRAPGIVREALKSVGDNVHTGEIMAWIESADLGDAKVAFMAKWAEVGCCTIDLARAQEVHDNTLELLAVLKSSPSLDTLRGMSGTAMGENRSALVSAYAEFVFAKAAYEREQALLEKKVSSETDFQAAQAAYKKADALYTATRDSIEFKVWRDLLEAKREQRMREMSLHGAERRLYVSGLTGDDIAQLERLAQSQSTSATEQSACDDPNCTDCVEHVPSGQRTAGAALPNADEKLAWYPLRAPFAGAVIEKHLTLGEKHGDDSAAFTVADLSTVWIDINVYQKDLRYVRTGQSVQVSAGTNGLNAQGTIAYVAPVVDEKTRTALARVVLPNPDGEWRPGLYVTAQIASGEENAAIVVPKTAIQRIGESTVVFVEAEDELEPATITLGRSNATHVEVASGLNVGQRYVAKGAFELKAKIITSGLGAHAGHGH